MSSKLVWQREISLIILSIALSSLVFLPVAMLVSTLSSWLIVIFKLSSWLSSQSQIVIWSVFGLISFVAIGVLMFWINKIIEQNLLSKIKNDTLALSISLFVLICVVIFLYFTISWFINFLNITFWLT